MIARMNTDGLLLNRKTALIMLGIKDVTMRFIDYCVKVPAIRIAGNIPDDSLGEKTAGKYSALLRKIGIPLLFLDEQSLGQADIIFSIEYRKIVPGHLVRKYHFINCHGGILPKWRGFCCNAWAILNGATQVGYSIHRMNERLDDGPLYYVKKIPIAETQTYADVYGQITESILYDVPSVLIEAVHGLQKTEKQKGSFAYCNKFSPKMGCLSNFNVSSDYLYNLYRCMAKPLGTGLYFYFKEKRFEIECVKKAGLCGLADYTGISGKVIYVTGEELWIKTADNGIVLSDIRDDAGNRIVPSGIFKNGNMIDT